MEKRFIKGPYFGRMVMSSVMIGMMFIVFVTMAAIFLRTRISFVMSPVFFILAVFLAVMFFVMLRFIKFAYVDDEGIELCTIFGTVKKLSWDAIVKTGYLELMFSFLYGQNMLFFTDDTSHYFSSGSHAGQSRATYYAVNSKKKPIALPISDYLIEMTKKHCKCERPESLM